MGERTERILSGMIRNKRIANAYMFTGGSDSDKLLSAKKFAAELNCTGENKPCGKCINCFKAGKGVHPDIIVIEKDRSSVKIDQVRAIKETVKYGPSEAAWLAVVIKDADSMTVEAANSFLKLLEEPPRNVVFILISGREGKLPGTISSRCQNIIFEDPAVVSPGEEAGEMFRKLERERFDYIDISSALTESEDHRGLLQELFTLYAEAGKTRKARAVLESIRGLERNANKKLVMDFLSFNLWTEN